MENRGKSCIPHSNLLRAISDFYGSQAITSPVRKEISTNISEYEIPPNAAESLEFALCKSFKSNGWKLCSQLSKTRSLTASEYAVLAKHISRDLSFRKLKKTLNRWNTTIQHMRNKEQLLFPLNPSTLLTNNVESTSTFKVEHLENQQTDSHVKGSEFKFSTTDAIELRKERAKFNARYSYMLAKAARHRKIKSKKYHRMLKQKQISCLESFSILKKSDPLKAGQLLESIEKKRAKERATLRHRNTGHWAQIRSRAKQSSERRKQLTQQMFFNSELNQKQNVTSSSEEEPEEVEMNNRQTVATTPWIANPVIDGDVLSRKLEHRLPSDKQDAPFHCKTVQFEMHLDESIRKNNTPTNLLDESSKNSQLPSDSNSPPLKGNETLNPDAFIEMKPRLFQMKDSCIPESSDDDTEVAERSMNINEAFSNDLVAEFRKEKEYISKTSQLENVDLLVPGWGKWSGNSSQIPARKQSQSAVTRNRVTFAKSKNKKDIIFMEDKTDKLKEQQVNEIPFSFTQMKDYEASIRFPIGSTWAPHTAHNKMVSPAVITKLGTVIKPIQQDVL